MFSNDEVPRTTHFCASWNKRYSNQEAFKSNAHGYKNGYIFGKGYFAHRVIWAIVNKEWPDVIDHINGNRSDNRIENLKSGTHAENMENCHFHREGKIAGVKKIKERYYASITINRKTHHLGGFPTIELAINARQVAKQKILDGEKK